jgi:hypothetical protein
MILGGSKIAQKTLQTLPNNFNAKVIESDKAKSYSLEKNSGIR